MDSFSLRSEMYWGKDFQDFLSKIHIIVFGLGGVGGYALEALARSGVGRLTIVDFDTVSKTNINRQIIALNSTIGLKKAQVFKERLLDINPDLYLEVFDDFYDEALNDEIFKNKPDFVVDAIDSMRSKISLLKYCYDNKIKVITSLGAGNRLDGSRLKVSDLSDVKSKCSFVKSVISNLQKAGIKDGMPICWSDEAPKSRQKVKNTEKIVKKNGEEIVFSKFTPSSTPVVPAISGLLMANYILRDLYENFQK